MHDVVIRPNLIVTVEITPVLWWNNAEVRWRTIPNVRELKELFGELKCFGADLVQNDLK